MGNEPFNARNPGPIKVLVGTVAPPYVNPKRLSIKLRIADSTGTTLSLFLPSVGSVVNSLTTTPCLNPKPSKLLNAILALNVTVPVPWSTWKKRPTLKIPFSSVLT